MKKFWLSVLRSDGRISSKRLITLLAFALIVFGFVANMIWKFTIDSGIFESVKWIVLGGLGFTASEQFSGKPTAPTPPTEPPAEEQPQQ